MDALRTPMRSNVLPKKVSGKMLKNVAIKSKLLKCVREMFKYFSRGSVNGHRPKVSPGMLMVRMAKATKNMIQP